ncbi:MAG: excisionase family DNA-binding protein [Alphaproteobacteria bacterium]|nr:excisionase family DNA-binding protein [Alphaproteobacteria bacterium]
MTALSKSSGGPFVLPSHEDAEFAKTTGRLFARHLTKKNELKVTIAEEPNSTVVLPAAIMRLLMDILSSMAKGDAIALIPMHAEMTTQQGADFLNVSRPYLIGLLEEGTIPYRKVGTHRRVLFEDLVKYKEEIDSARSASLDALTVETQKLGLDF